MSDIAHLLQSFESLQDQAFLGKVYIALLGRPVDATGFRDYMARLRQGTSRLQICEELATSEEGQRFEAQRRGAMEANPIAASAPVRSVDELLRFDGDQFVRQAYLALLGRSVDPSGLQHYTGQLSKGVSKTQIVADIYSDPEGQQYKSPLSGLEDLVRRVQIGTSTEPSGVQDLLLLDDDDFLRAAYRVLLEREPDPEGRSIYSDLVRSGVSKMYVIRELYRSPEASTKSIRLPGLARALQHYEKANRRTWVGWYYRNVKGVESDVPAEIRIRALGAQLRSHLNHRA
jgi:hypothetical protein